jgi:mono/diheme cytochrome c family protein/plastocyanin
MTDQPTRPSGAPGERLPARRETPATPARSAADRFTAPRAVHATAGLTPERAAKIVRQSGDARWVAFLGVAIVSLFVIVYYFYETGTPWTEPRLDAQADLQQVTAVERGYNLYQANCAQCHGVNGEGGRGPILNDQMKLYSHLTEQYLHNVLTVGGRYVCGDANSIMPVWSDENGGPLNYIAIEDLIAFLRADSTREYTIRDPELNEPVFGSDGTVLTFKGWRDTSFRPAADATPVPACYLGDGGQATPPPQASLPPDATIIDIVAKDIAFDIKEMTVPAGQPFGIHLTNLDVGIEHDVDIRLADATVVFDSQRITEGEITYTVPALEAGTYTFICSVHPIAPMTGTLTVE